MIHKSHKVKFAIVILINIFVFVLILLVATLAKIYDI